MDRQSIVFEYSLSFYRVGRVHIREVSRRRIKIAAIVIEKGEVTW